MRIAGNIAGFNMTTTHLDLLVCMYDLVTKEKGNGTIEDIVHIEIEVEIRAEEREKEKRIKKKQALLDEESKKKE